MNLPDGADPDDDPDTHYVGNVSLFGIEATNDLNRDVHGGTGLSFAFDITDIARTQQDAGRWDPSRLDGHVRPDPRPRAQGRGAAGPAAGHRRPGRCLLQVSELASSPFNTASPGTRPTSVSEEGS